MNDKNSTDVCSVCLGEPSIPIRLKCQGLHIFCFLCLKQSLILDKRCPLCRDVIDVDDLEDYKEDFFEIVKDSTNASLSPPEWIWQYAGRRFGYWNYDPTTNKEIEEGYQSFLSNNENERIEIIIGAKTYEIHYPLGTQRLKEVDGTLSKPRAIRRVKEENSDSGKGTAGIKNIFI